MMTREVDRLLKLLILAANDLGAFSRAFPWLELDDDRKSLLPMGKMGVESSEVEEGRGMPWGAPGVWLGGAKSLGTCDSKAKEVLNEALKAVERSASQLEAAISET